MFIAWWKRSIKPSSGHRRYLPWLPWTIPFMMTLLGAGDSIFNLATRVQDFTNFVDAKGYDLDPILSLVKGNGSRVAYWRNPGYDQDMTQPIA